MAYCNKRLILASGSPRRRELLDKFGINYEILPAQGEYLGYAHARLSLCRFVAVAHGAVKPFAQRRGYCALAAARHAYKHNVLHIQA